MDKESPKKNLEPEGEPAISSPLSSNLRLELWRNRILLAVIIALAVLWIYSPSYHGEWLWDDDQLLTANLIVQHRVSPDPNVPPDSLGTLTRLWFGPDGVDYFPLFYTALWALWPFFGLESTGYHITTIFLHIANALLLWALLAKMRIPGAWLAGFVFAIHPVCVESVAWVSELKNTLSLPFFLISCICWVGQDEEPDGVRRQRFYILAILFFLISMFTKTSVVAFPVVTLLYAWWKRGKVAERDIHLSLPLFAISLVLGLVTISYQWGRAIGQEKIILDSLFSLSGFIARLAIAGLGILHYLLTIVWPVGLLPIYPRWEVDPPKIWMFLAWPVILGVVWGMWRGRNAVFPPQWGRHAVFAFGFFLLMLAPVLGVVNISYMRITWVADHFIYMPMIGIIAFLCAGVVLFFNRLPEASKPKFFANGCLVLAVLAFLAFRYTMAWQNEDHLWEYTLKRNNDAWQAHNRLGAIKSARGDLDGAHYHFLNAVRLRPDLGETQNNLATTFLTRAQVFSQRGDQKMADQEMAAAIGHFVEACSVSSHVPVFHINLANALTALGRFQEAGEKYKEILGRDPNNPAMIQNYGIALYKQGRLEEAIAQFRRALEINPNLKDASDSLAMALAEQARVAKEPPQSHNPQWPKSESKKDPANPAPAPRTAE